MRSEKMEMNPAATMKATHLPCKWRSVTSSPPSGPSGKKWSTV
jgi:hypothetical protein